MRELSGGAGKSRDLRYAVSDADRDLVTERLNQVYATGKLALEDYLELLDNLYAVRTQSELELFVRELPASAQNVVPAVAERAPIARPGQLSEISRLPSLRGSSAELRFWLVVAGGLVGAIVVITVILGIVL